MSTDSLLKKSSPEGLPEKLTYRTSAASNLEDTQDYLIFFLSGNPGLISYYEPFLSRLRDLLESSSSRTSRFHIYGHSYRGFEVLPHAQNPDSPSGLDDQIKYQEDWLMQHVKNHQKQGGPTLKVILIGHSVGSYVLLEMIQSHLKAVQNNADVEDFDLIGGILLFPTVADIGKSPVGRIARLVLPLPGFARVVGTVAQAMAYLLGASALRKVVRFITRFPDYAVETTAALLRSPMGVRQALYLARDEMKMIKEDDWDNEVWGATTSPGTNKRDTINWNLFALWGKRDKWVADHTRDNIIKARGPQCVEQKDEGEERKCNMEIDDRGISHDFCTTIRNSTVVAEKVKSWIDEIIDKHSNAI